MTLIEMHGLLAGRCLPSDIRVNETIAEYLLRKVNNASALVAENTLLTSADTWLSHQQAGVAALEDADNAGLPEEEAVKAGIIAVIQSIRTPATDAAKSMDKLAEENEYLRWRFKESDILFGRLMIAMRAAVIEKEHGEGDKAGMDWIINTLSGPGEFAPEEETDAQEYHNRQSEILDAEFSKCMTFFDTLRAREKP